MDRKTIAITQEVRRELLAAARERVEDYRRLRGLGLISRDGDFFPSVHYPPITMYPPAGPEAVFREYRNPADGLFDVYVHIPFCRSRCSYCHYPVRATPPAEEIDRYLSALDGEMGIFLRGRGLRAIRVRSILIGGGTPNYLSPAQFGRFFDAFLGRLDLSSCTQFNLDVEPSALLGAEGEERLRIMKAAGADRLTIGIQSLDDGTLKLMNRRHTAEEAARAVERSRERGFTVNTEYIFGYPGQTLDSWTDVVARAIALDAEEIQLYRLKYIPYGDYNGAIARLRETGGMPFPSVEETLMMKQAAISLLARHGYEEDMRRVFTRKKGVYSHYAYNQCCRLYDQAGFGLTAFGSFRDRFTLNTQDFGEYHALVESGRLPVNRGVIRSREEQIRWAIVLPLKHHGVDKRLFLERTGVPFDGLFRDRIETLREHGLVIEDGSALKLTRLGCFFADEVCQQFHSPGYLPFPRDAYAAGELNPYR